MSEQLVKLEASEETEMAKMMGSSGKFLPRLQFMTANSKLCKEGNFPINNFALVSGSDYTDLGKTVDVILLGSRPKALDINIPLSCYKPNLDDDGNFTGDFKEIAERADAKEAGNMWGPEFLLYLPGLKKYATFFMSTITMRYEAPKVQAQLGCAVTFEGNKIVTKKHEYFSAVVTECDTILEPPEADEMNKVIFTFKNPPKQETERADDEESDATERDQ